MNSRAAQSPVLARDAGQDLAPVDPVPPPHPEAVTGKDDGQTTEHTLATQGAAAAPVTRQRPLSIPCPECEGEGGWYHYGAGRYEPDSAIRSWRECPECSGAGEFDVEDDDD